MRGALCGFICFSSSSISFYLTHFETLLDNEADFFNQETGNLYLQVNIILQISNYLEKTWTHYIITIFMLFVGLLLQNEMMSHKHKPDFIILLLIYHPQIMITSLPIHIHKSWIQVVLTASPQIPFILKKWRYLSLHQPNFTNELQIL